MAEHGDALRAHAEGKAAVFFGVVAAVAEHYGVHHACA